MPAKKGALVNYKDTISAEFKVEKDKKILLKKGYLIEDFKWNHLKNKKTQIYNNYYLEFRSDSIANVEFSKHLFDWKREKTIFKNKKNLLDLEINIKWLPSTMIA